MLSIAYASTSIAPLDDDDIAAILIKARANNRRDGVTGALLYHRERFVQILEAPDDVVRGRFAVIASDARHRSIQVIRELQVADRQFPQWTMGFHAVGDTINTGLAGYENILGRRGAERVKHAENEGQQFLEWLSEYWLPGSR